MNAPPNIQVLNVWKSKDVKILLGANTTSTEYGIRASVVNRITLTFKDIKAHGGH